MKKILVVCLGNICRSPIAEGIIVEACRLHDIEVQVDSAGMSSYHQGEAPDTRAIRTCHSHGIDISGQRSRPVKASDLDEFDMVLAMDESHRQGLLELAKEHNKHKIQLLTDPETGTSVEIPDPYYGNPTHFEEVYQLVHSLVEKSLIPQLVNRF
jgi:protein-tyrosine phosphatase